MGQQHPDTFEVASIDTLREVVQPGVYAKICILDGAFQGERIWTEVTEVDGVKVKATLANDPFGFEGKHGDPVEYQLRHIYNVAAKDGEELA
ncbi:MAG: hypothetical protein AMJ72_12305 [Acidithiobacillales bacterium SM1_46]|nr:MAG: hypothetical protein AMJ72_12305 [Acidithiobacillales bacterium SM1_46]